MTGVGAPTNSLRLIGPEIRRLLLVLAFSLALHLLVWGSYEAGRRLGWWQHWHWPAWMHLVTKKKADLVPVQQNKDVQLTFVEVPQPSAEAPKDAKYYSSQNSRASDPTRGDKEVPQLNGKQTLIVKTEDAPRPDFNKLQPAPPTPPEPTEEPPPTVKPGDLTLGKPEDSKQEEPSTRPRTVRQARAQQSQLLPGQQMKQEGGTHRQALVPSLDVKATPFGAYDGAFIAAVTQRWYDLLDSRQFAMDRNGKVTLRFRLNYDGSIADMKVLENTVGDVLG